MFTKGKWKVSRGGELMPEHERIIQSTIGFDPLGVESVVSICHTWEDPGPDEALANAHLIAAAPAMYEALHQAKEVMEISEVLHAMKGQCGKEPYLKVLQALAQAEGLAHPEGRE